ncbi:MAG: arginine--tRNA ligase [Eisenbergiella massiliensis]
MNSLRTMPNRCTMTNLRGIPQAEAEETIVLDYGNPNVAKPLHVGHLRSTIIGEALKKNHYSDRQESGWGCPSGGLGPADGAGPCGTGGKIRRYIAHAYNGFIK